ncbi:hypothetical protein GCM10009750_36140 [Agromyces salentinus]|uniref:Uncharacterized protein n=1 Tax=Agromyces salentinus TaxID=269421 RepID=A0ABP4Z8T9_9MICO
MNISSPRSPRCQNRRKHFTISGSRIATVTVLSALTIAGLTACTPDPREQLATPVACLVDKGWAAELDPNELAYGVEATEDQDFAIHQGDDSTCREQAGLPPRPTAPPVATTDS